MVPLVIGTGFLGRAVVDHLRRDGIAPLHTYHSNPRFPDSVQFDLFTQNIASIVDLAQVDCVIVTSLIESGNDQQAIVNAMDRLFSQCRGKRIVYLSTDAVFSGECGMYREDDEPSPKTAYGKHKLLCEQLLRRTVADYSILRVSYIYGFSLGSLDCRLSQARVALEAGGVVSKYIDMFKSPIDVNELARLTTLLAKSPLRGVLHAGGTRTSIYGFFADALGALGVSTARLVPDSIPDPSEPTCMRDTSLEGSLMQRTFGTVFRKPSDLMREETPSSTAQSAAFGSGRRT